MKLKLLGFIALVAVIGFSMSACKDEPEPAHNHDWEWTTSRPATCIAAGEEAGVCKLDATHTDTRVIAIDLVNGHDWNASVEVLSTVSETENGAKGITCKNTPNDPKHTKDEEIEWATGTDGLVFELISGGDNDGTYRVHNGGTANRTNFPTVHIPAYHRPDADSEYVRVTEIGNGTDTQPNNAFGGADSANANTTLTAVTFAAESQLKSIANYAFYYCTSLTSIDLPGGVTSIGNQAFQATSLASITIPDSVTSMGNSAFYNCTSLASITIPAGVTSIGTTAFNGCTSLASVTFAAGSQLESIDTSAFNGCTSLASVTIPDSVTSIGNRVFYNCTSLASVICLPTTPPSLGNTDAFNNTHASLAIKVPAASVDAYKAATNWSTHAGKISAIE